MAVKVSVIIPVYKAKKYISRCIYSLLDQSLALIELIVVDDKGGDGSMDVVRDLQQNNPKGSCIKIVEMPQNSGASQARNVGMKAASGEYIGFVDADDWCEAEMYEQLYAQAIEFNADFSYAQGTKDFSDGSHELLQQIPMESGIISKEKRSLMLRKFVAYFTFGIYKRDFLLQQKIIFPDGRYSEDSYFIWLVVLTAQRFAALNKPFYHYVQLASSVSNQIDKEKHHRKIELYQELYKDIEKRNLLADNADELLFLFAKKAYLIPLLIYISQTKKIDKAELMHINNSFISLFPHWRFSPYLIVNVPLFLLMRSFLFFPVFTARIVAWTKPYKKLSL